MVCFNMTLRCTLEFNIKMWPEIDSNIKKPWQWIGFGICLQSACFEELWGGKAMIVVESTWQKDHFNLNRCILLKTY